MDDLRQKLFPIFLNEAEKNLAALRQFLSYGNLAEATAEEMETAFRSAHTLKGTANLVKAESICKIARRLEGMLERHFEARTVPTPVEHEALKLAVDWLAPLVSALQGNLQEPTLFVTEALEALDLAEAFPGRTPLVELLDSKAAQRAPQLDDPFADDPELQSDVKEQLITASDPFAEDPSFGMGVDCIVDVSEDSGEASDPFAGDQDYSSAENLLVDDVETIASTNLSEAESALSEPFPYDPFAEDSLGIDIDQYAEDAPPTKLEESIADLPLEAVTDVGETDQVEEVVSPVSEMVSEPVVDPFAEDDFDLGVDLDEDSDVWDDASDAPEEPVAEEGSAVAADNDPFAEDDDFAAAADDDSVEPEPFDLSSSSATKRAEEFAASLLLPNREAVPRKDYVCCVFKIGERDYHLPIKQMQEIADLPQLLPLPLAPPMVSGLINLRGKVLPVINLAILNQHQQSEVRVQRRLVVAEYQGESLAFLVDGVPYLSEDFNGEKIEMAKFLSLYRIRGVEQ